MKVLVTGAAGLTGGAIARRLLEVGHEVLALVRDTQALLPPECERFHGELREHAWWDALRRCDAIAHVAGIGLADAVASADLTHLRRLVAVSSAGVYSQHRASAAAYRRSEDALQSARADVVILRPTMIYGSTRDKNVHHVISFARRWGVLPLVGRGDALLQPIHYEDVADAVVALIDSDVTGTIDAGGESALSLRDAGHAIFAALGRPPRFVAVPAKAALIGSRAAYALGRSRLAERVVRMTEDRTVDNQRLVTVTGVRPRDFATGVGQQVASDK